MEKRANSSATQWDASAAVKAEIDKPYQVYPTPVSEDHATYVVAEPLLCTIRNHLRTR